MCIRDRACSVWIITQNRTLSGWPSLKNGSSICRRRASTSSSLSLIHISSLRIFLNYISFPVTALFNLPRLHGRKYDAVFCYETSPVLMMLPAVVYAKLHRVPLTTYVLDLWPENLYSVMRCV